MARTLLRLLFLVGLPLILVFFVWIAVKQRGSRREGARMRAALAEAMGATGPSDLHIEGIYKGRRCSLQECAPMGSDNARAYVQIRVECRAPLTLEIVRARPALAKIDHPEFFATGDRAFDDQIEVRTNNPARVKEVLSADLRESLLTWYRRVYADAIWLKDGFLEIMGGEGFRETVEIEHAKILLDAGVRIAEGLEAKR